MQRTWKATSVRASTARTIRLGMRSCASARERLTVSVAFEVAALLQWGCDMNFPVLLCAAGSGQILLSRIFFCIEKSWKKSRVDDSFSAALALPSCLAVCGDSCGATVVDPQTELLVCAVSGRCFDRIIDEREDKGDEVGLSKSEDLPQTTAPFLGASLPHSPSA